MNNLLTRRRTEIASPVLNFPKVLVALYVLVSFLLILRFVSNLSRILRKVRMNTRIHSRDTTLFWSGRGLYPIHFQIHIVNRSDFENGKIESELICTKKHIVNSIIPWYTDIEILIYSCGLILSFALQERDPFEPWIPCRQQSAVNTDPDNYRQMCWMYC